MEQAVTPQALIQPIGTQWHSRKVCYYSGDWETVLGFMPEFELAPFSVGQDENPFLRTVIRLPLNDRECPIPVGAVSRTYCLVPHREVAKLCLKGLLDADAGIKPDQLRYEVGLSEFGEWMNLRIYLPDEYSFKDQETKLNAKLECFNSVDASSRLVILFGWHRLVCSNGLIIGETKIEIKERHGQGLIIGSIPERIRKNIGSISDDCSRLKRWQSEKVSIEDMQHWVDNKLSEEWGKKAAARTFHICNSGKDIKFKDPFAPGRATEKPFEYLSRVPGSEKGAKTKYDVSQVLSFVATHRNNAEERVVWQAGIPRLLKHLCTSSSQSNSLVDSIH